MKSTCLTPHLTQLNNLKNQTKSKTKFIKTQLLFKTAKPNIHHHRLTSLRTSKHSHAKTSQSTQHNDPTVTDNIDRQSELKISSTSAVMPPPFMGRKLSLADQAFFLLTFIAFTTSVAFIGLVTAMVPTLRAMGRAAISLSKLVDTAREEIPSTMAAMRLSGMEISNLTLELSDLSQEIADGVTKSAQAVHAAEVGIQQVGSLAREKTISMIDERAKLPEISLQHLVAGAARKTSKSVGQATRTLINKISGNQKHSENEDTDGADELLRQ